MKKIIALVLSLAICFLIGCTANETTASSTAHPEATLPQAQETTVGTDRKTDATTATQTTVTPPTVTTEHSEEPTTEQTTVQTTAPLPPPPTSWNGYTRLPGTEHVNFNGRTFVIAGYLGGDGGTDNANEIYAEGSTSVDYAVRERNQAIEVLYNCTILPYFSARPVEVTASYIRCGRDDIDLYAAKYAVLNSAKNKHNHSLYNLGMDLSASYWDQSFVEGYTAKKGNTSALISITGDFSYHSFDMTQVILFNRDLYHDVFALSGDYADAYRFVHEGNWTVDTYAALLKYGEASLLQSNAVGWVHPRRALSSAYTAADLSLIGNVNGNFVYGLLEDTAGSSRKLDQATTLWNLAQSKTASEQEAREIFSAGGALFLSDIMLSLKDLSKAADFGIGVLPYPKADPAQTEYVHTVHADMVTYQVPITVQNPSELGKFFEIYAAFSRMFVRPAWIEMQAYEYCADPEVVEMLTLILDSRRYDPAHLIWTEYEQPITQMIENEKNTLERHVSKATGDVVNDVTSFYNQTLFAHTESKLAANRAYPAG
jgi:hypothetical protein